MHDASMYLYQELLNTNRYRSCQYWKYQRKYFISISEEFITYLSEEKKSINRNGLGQLRKYALILI